MFSSLGARRLTFLGLWALFAATLAAPPASADTGQYVKTQSGKVQCVLYDAYPGTDPRYGGGGPQVPPGSIVMCETSAGSGWGPGRQFAAVDAGGNFSFQCCASGLAGSIPIDFLTMAYGQNYNVKGWAISANQDGTRFTNNATSHGMFVSIENVYGF